MTVQRSAVSSDDDYTLTLGIGSASFSIFPRFVTEAEKKRWRKEDAERDARKIPLGFRLGHSASDPKAGRFPDVPHFDVL